MPSHTYSMLGMWTQSVASNTKSRMIAREQAARLWPGAAHPGEPHHLDFAEYACCKWDRRDLRSSYAMTTTL